MVAAVPVESPLVHGIHYCQGWMAATGVVIRIETWNAYINKNRLIKILNLQLNHKIFMTEYFKVKVKLKEFEITCCQAPGPGPGQV